MRPEDFSVNKSEWQPGPWQEEPDRVDFEHAGFHCLILRNASGGHLCGYVGVQPGHPWHGEDFSAGSIDGEWPDVHGGITYSEECAGNICHTPKPGEPEHLFWQGFDCAHLGDLSPGHMRNAAELAKWLQWETYKGVAFVRSELESLAEQAARALTAANPPAMEVV